MIYGNKLGKLFDRHVILIFADAIMITRPLTLMMYWNKLDLRV